MKKLFIFAVCILCGSLGLPAQEKFNVQNGTKTEFYNDLETAVQNAVSGDTIYLPGGTNYEPFDLVIDKKLALIGVGWDTDSLAIQPTWIANVNFRNGSDGSLITGCSVRSISFGHRNESDEIMQNISNVSIWRNRVDDVINLGVNNADNSITNISIRENYVSRIDGYNASGCVIENNVIAQPVYNESVVSRVSASPGFRYAVPDDYGISKFKNSRISNNFIWKTGQLDECIVENNYLRSVQPDCNNCIFNNNAFLSDVSFPDGTNEGENNLVSQEIADTFIRDFYSVHPSYLLINPSSPCKNAGADGADICIYGGALPYQAGAIPFNPHLRKAAVDTQTDKTGKLHVEIVATAQDTLTVCEYWINDDYSDKQTIAIDNQSSFALDFFLDNPDMRNAVEMINAVHFRFQDELGQWSSVFTAAFWRIEADFTFIDGLSEVTFTDITKYTEYANQYYWDFGDGYTSALANPVHTYNEPGAYQVNLTVHNQEWTISDVAAHYVEIEGIRKISNNRGGNKGYASFDIYGGGLNEQTIVQLVKEGVTISTHIVYQREPGIICATFDLTDQAVGVYDIIITTTSGKEYILNDGFTIEEANYPEVFASLESSGVFIPGRWQTYTVHYGNRSNTDVYGLPVNLIFENGIACEFAFDLMDNIGGNILNIQDPDNYTPITSITSELFGGRNIMDVYQFINDYSDIISLSSEAFNGKMYSVLIPHIPANTSGSFSFRLSINTSSTKIYVSAGEILNDFYFNTQEENVESDEMFGYQLTQTFDIDMKALSEIIRREINKSFVYSQTAPQKQLINFSGLLDLSNCFSNVDNLRMANDIYSGPKVISKINSMCNINLLAPTIDEANKALEPNGCGPANGWYSDYIPDLLFRQACDEHDRGYGTCRRLKIVTDFKFLADMTKACNSTYTSVSDSWKKPMCIQAAQIYFTSVFTFGGTAYVNAQNLACHRDWLNDLSCPDPTNMTPQRSSDPNEILGTPGYGENNYLNRWQNSLNYTIYFENDPEKATAPAQEIVLRDTLDLTQFDPDGFSFGTFTFRNITVEAVPGLTEFSKDIDMRDRGENMIIRISGTFDKATGIIQWHFIAFDPETMALTENPNLGVLYPNDAPPIGEGNVTYRIGVKNNLPDETVIANQAHIIFDLNESIATNTYQNTVDYSAPVSRMNPAYETVSDTSIVVSWTGSDTGSGIRFYAIFVSENEQPYFLWLSHTTATSATWEGHPQSKYQFYVAATDHVGNVEGKNETAELEVTFAALVEETVETPVASIPSGSAVAKNTQVTLSSATEGAAIYYTTDGSSPSQSTELEYTQPVVITEDITIHAMAVKEGMLDSEIAVFEYTVIPDVIESVETPVASIPSGSVVAKNTQVTLSSATDGATILYTVDGSSPSQSTGLEYTQPIVITEDITIHAIAIKEGMSDSEIAVFEYTVIPDVIVRVETPVASIPSGSVVEKNTEVTLSSATEWATILYTIDGSSPSQSTGLEYMQPVVITEDITIHAIAIKEGMSDSEIATFEYSVINNTGINQAEKQTIIIYVRNQTLYIKGLEPGELYTVYSVLGKAILQGISTHATEQMIHLPYKGVFIISTPTIKAKVSVIE